MDMIVFHWCGQVNRNKSKHQSRDSLLPFTVLQHQNYLKMHISFCIHNSK